MESDVFDVRVVLVVRAPLLALMLIRPGVVRSTRVPEPFTSCLLCGTLEVSSVTVTLVVVVPVLQSA